MTAPAASGDVEKLVARALVGLQLLTLAVGVMHFTFASGAVAQPVLAAAGLALLAIATVLSRALAWPQTRQHGLDVAALILSITMLAAATGGARSVLLPLFLIPLTSAALAYGRWWLVLLLAAVAAGCMFALGWMTTDANIGSPEFGVQVLSVIAPCAAVALILAGLIEQVRTAAQRISDLAATDSLTGLMNLRAFEDVLQQEHRKAERSGRPYTLLVIDVDNLAQVNEMLGHDAGSQILGAVASAISRSIRNSDVAARLGGDEFVVLLIEADAATGAAIAQRIRNNVFAGTVSVANRLVRANVSVGVANFPDDHLYPKELMILADRRMQHDRDLRRPPAA